MRRDELIDKLAERQKVAIDPIVVPALSLAGGTALLGAALASYLKTLKRKRNREETFDINRTMPLKQASDQSALLGTRRKGAVSYAYVPPASARFADGAISFLTKVKAIDPLTSFILPAAGIHLGALGLYALLRKTVGKEKLQSIVGMGRKKEADAIGLGALVADTALASELAGREGRTADIPVDALVPASVTTGIVPLMLGNAQSIPSDQDLDDMDKEWAWNFFPVIGALRYFRRMKRIKHDAEILRREREARVRAEQNTEVGA